MDTMKTEAGPGNDHAPFRCNGWLQEALIQFRTAFPSLVSMLLYKIPWMISLRFVGDIGAMELAAAALATTLCNVTGMSISVGLSSALTTLSAQARGDLLFRLSRKDRHSAVHFAESAASEGVETEASHLLHRNGSNGDRKSRESSGPEPLLPIVYLYRGLIIQFWFALPIGLWWLHGIESFLVWLGQGQHLSSMTSSYLRILVPGLWSFSINWTIAAWLQAVELAHVPVYAATIGLVLHVPLNYLFIDVLGWGYLGCAAATVMFQFIQPLITIGYLFASEKGRSVVLEAIAASAIGRKQLFMWIELKEAVNVKGWLTYLGLAVPGIVIISEWWASEVSIFLAGRLIPYPDLALGSMTLYQSINAFCFMFPVSWGVAGSARVGNLLGGGDVEGAKLASNVTLVCAGLVSGALGCVLYWTPHQFFPSLFAPDEPDLVHETARTMSLLAVYVFADGIQAAFNGIIKGCGRQPVIMPVVVIAYWIVGVPLAYHIAFHRFHGVMCTNSYFCGQVGLVTGMTVGT
jgi:multidrug resistance protein, MATE family